MIRKFILAGLLYLCSMIAVSMSSKADDLLPEPELLLMQKIPMVITAAKVAQPILESPFAITVLTKEDIERYGITSFADIMRNVPGVDVMSMSSVDRNIDMRGLNQPGAGKILVLIDNRAINLDSYGEILWEFMPVSINEIERIEIIKGPGSALYGANAFGGVINIITDASETSSSTKAIGRINQFGKPGGFVIHKDIFGNLGHRILVGWSKLSGWSDKESGAGQREVLDARVQYDLNNQSKLLFSGGVGNDKLELTELSGYDSVEDEAISGYIKASYERPNLKGHFFWDWSETDALVEKNKYNLEHDILDFELQHSFRPIDNNLIIWGVNYQFSQEISEMLGGKHNQNLIAGYVQNQLQLFNSLNLTAGLRYDRHQLTGNNLSPRFSIVYSPLKGHAFRASYGRAFRNPPFIYSYISMDTDMSIPMLPMPVNIEVLGNEDLVPEKMQSIDFGYRGIFSSRFSGGADIFINRISGLTEFGTVETYDADSLFAGSPGGVIPSLISALNTGDAKARGGEANAKLYLTKWLSANANYSYQYITDSETGEQIESAPRHKFNSGLYMELKQRLLVSLYVNYVDGTVWGRQTIASYILLNSVIRYRLRDLDFTLSVSNLLNDRHLEHPDGQEIGRSIILGFVYRMR